MAEHPGLQRAKHLMDLGRHAMAAGELRRALHDQPEDAVLHAYLALCLAEDPATLTDAAHEAIQATVCDPMQALAWYALSRVEGRRGNLRAAEEAVGIALGINPGAPLLHAQLAELLLSQDRWKASLEASARGLEVAPDDETLLNLHGAALSRLGRHEEAWEAIERALERTPESAVAHANAGWTLLRAGVPAPALRHFREALRLEPGRGRAREGMMEALRARSPIYRAFLRLSLRLPWVPPEMKWVAVVAALFAVLLLLMLEWEGVPAWITRPLGALAILGAVLTWTARSLFDLLLFSDPLGRPSLSRDERLGALATAASLGGAVACGLVALATGAQVLALVSVILVFYTIPIQATLRATPGRPRRWLALYTLLLLLPAAAFVWMEARDAGDHGAWFVMTVCGMVLSDLFSGILSGRL